VKKALEGPDDLCIHGFVMPTRLAGRVAMVGEVREPLVAPSKVVGDPGGGRGWRIAEEVLSEDLITVGVGGPSLREEFREDAVVK
jgi:hypothetical protein